MPMSTLLELAQRGDPDAIARVLNHPLQARGVTATVDLVQGCLQVTLTAAHPLPQDHAVSLIYQVIRKLQPLGIAALQITGIESNQTTPAWCQTLPISGLPEHPTPAPTGVAVPTAAAIASEPETPVTLESELADPVGLASEPEAPVTLESELADLVGLASEPEASALAESEFADLAAIANPSVAQTTTDRATWMVIEREPAAPVIIESEPEVQGAIAASEPPVVIKVSRSSRAFTQAQVKQIPSRWRDKFAGLTSLVVGLGFCATGVGIVLGIPLITSGLSLLQDHEKLEGPCPHCGSKVAVLLDGPTRFACSACHQSIQVKARKFYSQT